MNIVEKSIQIALRVHEGQFDLGGNPYIFHPLSVMISVEEQTRKWDNRLNRLAIMCASILHDTLEDCDPKDKEVVSREIYNLGSSDYGISTTVYGLTRKEKETWKSYISRVENDKWATIIKIVDLEKNIDLTRLSKVTEKDEKRNKMYLSTLKKLKKVQKENGWDR